MGSSLVKPSNRESLVSRSSVNPPGINRIGAHINNGTTDNQTDRCCKVDSLTGPTSSYRKPVNVISSNDTVKPLPFSQNNSTINPTHSKGSLPTLHKSTKNKIISSERGDSSVPGLPPINTTQQKSQKRRFFFSGSCVGRREDKPQTSDEVTNETEAQKTKDIDSIKSNRGSPVKLESSEIDDQDEDKDARTPSPEYNDFENVIVTEPSCLRLPTAVSSPIDLYVHSKHSEVVKEISPGGASVKISNTPAPLHQGERRLELGHKVSENTSSTCHVDTHDDENKEHGNASVLQSLPTLAKHESVDSGLETEELLSTEEQSQIVSSQIKQNTDVEIVQTFEQDVVSKLEIDKSHDLTTGTNEKLFSQEGKEKHMTLAEGGDTLIESKTNETDKAKDSEYHICDKGMLMKEDFHRRDEMVYTCTEVHQMTPDISIITKINSVAGSCEADVLENKSLFEHQKGLLQKGDTERNETCNTVDSKVFDAEKTNIWDISESGLRGGKSESDISETCDRDGRTHRIRRQGNALIDKETVRPASCSQIGATETQEEHKHAEDCLDKSTIYDTDDINSKHDAVTASKSKSNNSVSLQDVTSSPSETSLMKNKTSSILSEKDNGCDLGASSPEKILQTDVVASVQQNQITDLSIQNISPTPSNSSPRIQTSQRSIIEIEKNSSQAKLSPSSVSENKPTATESKTSLVNESTNDLSESKLRMPGSRPVSAHSFHNSEVETLRQSFKQPSSRSSRHNMSRSASNHSSTSCNNKLSPRPPSIENFCRSPRPPSDGESGPRKIRSRLSIVHKSSGSNLSLTESGSHSVTSGVNNAASNYEKQITPQCIPPVGLKEQQSITPLACSVKLPPIRASNGTLSEPLSSPGDWSTPTQQVRLPPVQRTPCTLPLPPVQQSLNSRRMADLSTPWMAERNMRSSGLSDTLTKVSDWTHKTEDSSDYKAGNEGTITSKTDMPTTRVVTVEPCNQLDEKEDEVSNDRFAQDQTTPQCNASTNTTKESPLSAAVPSPELSRLLATYLPHKYGTQNTSDTNKFKSDVPSINIEGHTSPSEKNEPEEERIENNEVSSIADAHVDKSDASLSEKRSNNVSLSEVYSSKLGSISNKVNTTSEWSFESRSFEMEPRQEPNTTQDTQNTQSEADAYRHKTDVDRSDCLSNITTGKPLSPGLPECRSLLAKYTGLSDNDKTSDLNIEDENEGATNPVNTVLTDKTLLDKELDIETEVLVENGNTTQDAIHITSTPPAAEPFEIANNHFEPEKENILDQVSDVLTPPTCTEKTTCVLSTSEKCNSEFLAQQSTEKYSGLSDDHCVTPKQDEQCQVPSTHNTAIDENATSKSLKENDDIDNHKNDEKQSSNLENNINSDLAALLNRYSKPKIDRNTGLEELGLNVDAEKDDQSEMCTETPPADDNTSLKGSEHKLDTDYNTRECSEENSKANDNIDVPIQQVCNTENIMPCDDIDKDMDDNVILNAENTTCADISTIKTETDIKPNQFQFETAYKDTLCTQTLVTPILKEEFALGAIANEIVSNNLQDELCNVMNEVMETVGTAIADDCQKSLVETCTTRVEEKSNEDTIDLNKFGKPVSECLPVENEIKFGDESPQNLDEDNYESNKNTQEDTCKVNVNEERNEHPKSMFALKENVKSNEMCQSDEGITNNDKQDSIAENEKMNELGDYESECAPNDQDEFSNKVENGHEMLGRETSGDVSTPLPETIPTERITTIKKQIYEEGLKPCQRDGGVAFFIPVSNAGLQPQNSNTDIGDRLAKPKKSSMSYEERMMMADINRHAHLSKKKEFAVKDLINVKTATGSSASPSCENINRDSDRPDRSDAGSSINSRF